MAPEKSVDAGVLAVWKAKYAALGRLIEVYEEAERVGALGGVFDPADPTTASPIGATPKAPMDLPVGVFRGKSLKEAIPIYLGAGRRKQTNKEIALGLQAGGFPTTAENFEATVATALYRLKNDGTILRFSDGWDLAASYPDSLRGRLEKDDKPRRKRRNTTANGRRRASAKQKSAATKKKSTPTMEKSSGENADRQIASFLGAHNGQYFTPRQIAEGVGATYERSFTIAFARLSHAGKVTRREDGQYTAERAAVDHLNAV